MSSVLLKKDWKVEARKSLNATQIIAKLVEHPDWVLDGNGTDVAIQKTYTFSHYLETMSFVNAVAFIAERHNHHPDMVVQYGRCTVRFNTHDVGGISLTDFDCAAEVDALVAPR